jgi:hypothetical protein
MLGSGPDYTFVRIHQTLKITRMKKLNLRALGAGQSEI